MSAFGAGSIFGNGMTPVTFCRLLRVRALATVKASISLDTTRDDFLRGFKQWLACQAGLSRPNNYLIRDCDRTKMVEMLPNQKLSSIR